MNAKPTVIPIPTARIVRTLGHYVEGKSIASQSGQWGSVFDPAIGSITARVPLADATETRAAIHAELRCRDGQTRRPCRGRACCFDSKPCSRRMRISLRS